MDTWHSILSQRIKPWTKVSLLSRKPPIVFSHHEHPGRRATLRPDGVSIVTKKKLKQFRKLLQFANVQYIPLGTAILCHDNTRVPVTLLSFQVP